MTRNEIIQQVQSGKDVRFDQIYVALSDMPVTLLARKKKENKYQLPETEWELLMDAATDGLIKAIQTYDCKKNDNIEAWTYKLMEQQFNKKLNTIIRRRMREESAETKILLAIDDSSDLQSPGDDQTDGDSTPKRHPLTTRDYELLEYIIERNSIRDPDGNPLCPNSSDILCRGRFEKSFRSRTTLSESIRRLKDAGYRFAEKEDRGANQGYYLLNPELYHNLSFEEKLALDVISHYLPAMTDGPVKSGLALLRNRVLKDYQLDGGNDLVATPDVIRLSDHIKTDGHPQDSVDTIIFKACYNAARSRSHVSLVYKDGSSSTGASTCLYGTVTALSLQQAEWYIAFLPAVADESVREPIPIPVSQIILLQPSEHQTAADRTSDG